MLGEIPPNGYNFAVKKNRRFTWYINVSRISAILARRAVISARRKEVVIGVSESEFDSETLRTASDWISTFKGPNVCAKRFSHVSPLHLTLVQRT